MEVTSIELNRSFLELHLTEIQFAAIFGGMILLFLVEGFIPRRTSKIDQSSRWINNIGLALFNHFLIIFYSIFLFALISKFAPESPVIQYFKIPDLPSFLLVLIVMEFITYWIHRVFHKTSILWRIHAVHHNDVEIDVTTSHRHHPFEPILNALIITPVLFVLGAPLVVLATYNFLQTAFSLFSHSNIALPEKMDKVMRLFFVTPDFHRMHHSSDKQYTNSNYSAIVPWFDYLFGTASRLPYSDLPEMELGLEKMRESKDSRIDQLLITPFTYKP